MVALELSDEVVGAFLPVVVYWVYCGFYEVLCSFKGMESRRLHPVGEEAVKNVADRPTVVWGVLVQQFFQIISSLLAFTVAGGGEKRKEASFPATCLQIFVAMCILDTWVYFVHRTLHTFPFLYKHIHSKHHSLVVTYSFGALYNHPLEGLVSETLGSMVAFLLSGMTPRTALYFFSFATIKTVDDHCGLWLPWNPLQALFVNNSACHDVHHQLYGNKYNFSSTFFTTWDRLLGTYMPYDVVERKGGGFESRPVTKEA